MRQNSILQIRRDRRTPQIPSTGRRQQIHLHRLSRPQLQLQTFRTAELTIPLHLSYHWKLPPSHALSRRHCRQRQKKRAKNK